MLSKNKSIMIILIIIIMLGSTLTPGCLDQEDNKKNNKSGSTSQGVIIIPAASTLSTDNPKYEMSSYYRSDGLTINSSISEYTLPLDLSSITNIDDFNSKLFLTEEQKNIIKSNGFVVIDYGDEDDIIQAYKDMKERYELPIFVTTDTILHLYHIQFDEILKGIEEREFFDKILNLTKSLFDKSKEDYDTFTDSDLKEAAKRNIAFFSVALSLLQTPTEDYDGSENIYEINYNIPSYVQEEVNSEINLIEEQEKFEFSPIFLYKEDYTQYKPRGHYTQSEKLKRYFKALMWYGRISFLLKGGEPNGPTMPFLISEQDSKIQTIQASLIASYLPNVDVNEEKAEDIWNRLYVVTSFFVGTSDDLTPYEYLDSIKEVYGLEFNTSDLPDDDKIFDLKVELAKKRSPEIYGGTGEITIVKPPGDPFTIEDLNQTLEKTKGMRLMGQRFIPDSYMFQQLVFPAVDPYTGGEDTPFTWVPTDGGPTRGFPRGLDIMAVLGSQKALEILEEEGDTEYTNYYKQLNMLKENFSSLNTTEWNKNLYFSWIYTLKSLLKEYNSSYPSFMQTESWQKKELHTALASWAELRHDTILYAKQSYTPGKATSIEPQEKPVVGYVEPTPEFYVRILALTQMTKNGLTDLNVLTTTEKNRLESLETIIQRLLEITQKELENQELTESDYQFIRNFGESLDSIVTGVKDKGKETTIIADVHTDINTKEVLEEGVGYVDLILVAYKVPDGRIIMGAGPVMSYYEFKHPMNDRLTDEKWKTMLEENDTPDRAPWTNDFILE